MLCETAPGLFNHEGRFQEKVKRLFSKWAIENYSDENFILNFV